MKLRKSVILVFLCVSFLTCAGFWGCRTVTAKASMHTIANSNNADDFTYYIEYQGVKYYESSLLNLPDFYSYNELNEKKIANCRFTMPLITFSIYSYQSDENIDMLFRKNSSVLGPSGGWVYIREDYIFPTIDNSEVLYVELEGGSSIAFHDEKFNRTVVDYIKRRGDLSELFPIEKYGSGIINVYFADSPVHERIGVLSTDGYIYMDEL